MSNSLEAYADGLVEETLVETATTFFGARVALEQEVERYHAKAEELAEVEETVLRRAAQLHFLLLDGAAAEDFYGLIGVSPGHLLDAGEIVGRGEPDLSVPFALTPSGRYAKLVFGVYGQLVQAVEAYLHGEYSTDSRGRKRLSVNYELLQEWCTRLNEKIDALNNDHSPSGTLCFVKGLDPAMIKRERLSEATLEGYTQELDRELAFKPVECLAMNYLAAPELPAPDKVRKQVLGFCRRLYADSRPQMKRLLAEYRSALKAD